MLKKIEDKISLNKKIEKKFTYESSGENKKRSTKRIIKPTQDHSLKLILNEEFKEEDLGKIWKKFTLMKLKQKIESFKNNETDATFSKTISDEFLQKGKSDSQPKLKFPKNNPLEKQSIPNLQKTSIFKRNESDIIEEEKSQNLIRKLCEKDNLSLMDFMHLPKSNKNNFFLVIKLLCKKINFFKIKN